MYLPKPSLVSLSTASDVPYSPPIIRHRFTSAIQEDSNASFLSCSCHSPDKSIRSSSCSLWSNTADSIFFFEMDRKCTPSIWRIATPAAVSNVQSTTVALSLLERRVTYDRQESNFHSSCATFTSALSHTRSTNDGTRRLRTVVRPSAVWKTASITTGGIM